MRRLRTRLTMLLAMIGANACAGPRADLIEAGRIDVAYEGTEKLRATARAHAAGPDELVVYGTLHHETNLRVAIRGRMQATLIAPNGDELARAGGDVRPTRHGRWGHVHGEFRLTLEAAAPPGSRLVLAFEPIE